MFPTDFAQIKYCIGYTAPKYALITLPLVHMYVYIVCIYPSPNPNPFPQPLPLQKNMSNEGNGFQMILQK